MTLKTRRFRWRIRLRWPDMGLRIDWSVRLEPVTVEVAL